jgi:hypothetical protein
MPAPSGDLYQAGRAQELIHLDWRFAAYTPERLSLRVLAALCDIFGISPGDLIVTQAENATVRKAAFGYSTTRAEHLAAAAGSTWKTHAPGDHDAGSHRNEQPQRCPDL